ncbi:hypothetical protein [Rhodovulum kholense]|uniref:Sulfotransferase family protein n=1 Tax=Rhodovulum kholense TaxID=453584 RepID=A0A8E2VMI8_9RHOB|nr:hypothetical protein [Rhodovulum kholense]PTW50443.1 hypothetical protein C8N38_10477 [Rhodovulum kholense]
MAKKVILHIGRHKTGTTGLQLFLESGSLELAKSGFCYPLAGRDQSPGQSREDRAAHHGFARALIGPRDVVRQRLSALRPLFLDEVKDAHTVILSSEGFQNVLHLDLLAEFLDGFEIEVVGYLREYLAYVTSAYAQEIKGSRLASDFFFFEERFGLNLPDFIARWRHMAKRCHWRLYDRRRLVDGNVIADFVSTAGLPLAPSRAVVDSNLSISGNLLGFKLLLNMLGLHQPEFGPPMNALVLAHPGFGGPIFLDSATQQKLRSRNSCNRVLTELFSDVSEFDFEAGNRIFDPASLEQDMKTILSEFSAFERVISHPFIASLARGQLDSVRMAV